jgi:hypothetical protein
MDELTLIQSILTILAAAAIYIYLVASVYPWLTMHAACRRGKPCSDRGLRRVRFPEGRGVVYQPDLRVRHYVPQYAIFTREGNKYIRLCVDSRVQYIRYDVIALDRRGRLLDVLEVSERLTAEGATRAVRLPTATAYARVIPRRVDGEYVGKEVIVGYSLVGTAVFGALTVLTTVLVGYLLHGELAYLLTELSGMPPISMGRTVVISALLGVLYAAWAVLMHYLHAFRRINR